MRRVLIALTILTLATAVSLAVPAMSRAAEFGSRDEAIAMVHRVQDKFHKDGPEATFRAVNSAIAGAKSGFVDRDLYVFIYTLDGTCVANGQTPAVRNRNLLDMKDQDGKFLIQEFIKIAGTPPGHGWSDYRWSNPVTRTVEDKSAWIERMGDFLVGVGIYKNEQINETTIGVISGSPSSDDTYLQMAYDLADVLNDGDNLRILPIAGIGGSRNIRDVRYLRGVDIGLTQLNILNSFRRSNQRIGQYDDRIVYVAKLFNEEVHLVAKSDITSIDHLKGRKVNLDARASGTSYSMRDLFQTYGIEVEEVSMSQVEALEKVKSGDIAATALIAGKPVQLMSRLGGDDGLHLVPLPYPALLIGDYMPAVFSHEDYPGLVPPGQTVDTVAVGTVMIAYNWPKTSTDRYRRVERFVAAFFPKIAEFQKPPRHVKWREVNLAATLPNWTRLPAAQEWLDNHHVLPPLGAPHGAPPDAGIPPPMRRPPGLPAGGMPATPVMVDPALYQEFLRWRQLRGE